MNENENLVDFGDLGFGDISEEGLDLAAMEFAPDASDLALTTDFNFDFGSLDEEEDFGESENVFEDASEVLRSYADVSGDLISYYQSALNALQKLFSGNNNAQRKRVHPSITELSYIADEEIRQRVYGHLCQALDDLVTDKSYADLSPEEAFALMLDEIYKDWRWTPGIFMEKFRRTFFSVYENNKKLANATVVSNTCSIDGLLDRETLQISELVFRVNSVPFQAVSRYLSDPANLNDPETRIPEQSFGEFGSELKRNSNSRFLTKRMVFSGVIQFLTSEETLRMLGLAETDASEFSLGELLRRFILKELTDGDFVPTGIEKLPTVSFSEELLSTTVVCLYKAIAQRSFAAEIIFLLMNIMLDNSGQDKIGQREYFQSFTVGIAQYLSAFCQSPSYVNPVFYTLVSKVEGGKDTDFCVTYTEDNQVRTANVTGILCEVIGNNRTVYKIPLVHIALRGHSAVCPPREVIDSIDRAVTAGRVNINGEIRYAYTPSYSWLSSLNITVSSSTEEQTLADSKDSHTDNPLLAILMSYDNHFDTSGAEPEVISIKGQGIEQLLGVDLHKGEDSSSSIVRLVFSDGTVADPGGVFVRDGTDNSLVVRYNEPRIPQGGVLVLNSGEYEMTSHREVVESKVQNTELINSLLGIPMDSFGTLLGNPYLRATTRLVCERNAMDYEQQLVEVRTIIARDLTSVLRLTALDELLGYNSIRLFADMAEGSINQFNFQTIKAVYDATYGVPNDFTEMDRAPADLLDKLRSCGDLLNKCCNELCNYFENLNMRDLALQGVSRGELSGSEMGLYRALHYIPFFHARFRELEDYMVLIRVLNEIGDDVVSIFMKSSVASSVYREICTKDTISTLEGKLASASRVKTPLVTTHEILDSTLSEHCIILKYFALERNVYGVLTTLEECLAVNADERHKDIYTRLKADFGFDPDSVVSQIPEEDVCKGMTKLEIDHIFASHFDDILFLVYSGLVADVSHNVNLRVVKAFDIFASCGRYLFNFSEENMEDFSNTTEFEEDFLTYAGSFMLSFSPISGEAEDDIDGGMDRMSAYIRHRLDFLAYDILSKVEDLPLTDLRHVEGADGSDAFMGDSPD